MKQSNQKKRAPSTPPAPHIDALRKILGETALLVPVIPKTKKAAIPWADLRIEAMDDPRHLAHLAKSNIAVALGINSAGLISIDIDDDNAAAGFLERNPALSASFQTKGQRGCNVWLRMLSTYPKTTKLTLGGKPWGEFRSHGGYTVAWGTHPAGVRYRWLNREPAMPWPFESIHWPDGLEGFSPKRGTCTDGEDVTVATDVAEAVRECVGVGLSEPQVSRQITLEYVLSVATPLGVHQTHPAIWKLARGVKAIEIQEGGRPFSPERLRSMFDAWHKHCPPTFSPATQRNTLWNCYPATKT